MERLTDFSEQQRQARLAYARANLNRNWENVIFSDEKMFYAIPISGYIWGWISRQGPGEMVIISERLNSVGYTEILEEVLIPSIEICYENVENVLFMQDKNPSHTSSYTRNWFNNHPQITLLNVPMFSPDLNPMENVWAKTIPNWQDVFPRNRAILDPMIVRKWESFRGNTLYFENLYDSMPYRMQQVIENNGGPITNDQFELFF